MIDKRKVAIAVAVSMAVLLLIGYVEGRLLSSRRTVTVSSQSSQSEELRRLEASMVQAVSTLAERQQKTDSLLTQAMSRQANVETRTVERIERYAPSPATSPTPVIIQGGAGPQPISEGVSRDPVEIVTRTIEALDRSREERNSTEKTTASSSETVASSEKTAATAAETTAAKTSSEATARTVEEPAALERDRNLGIGVTSSGKPFLSYDLTKGQLGPRALGMGKLGAGLFVTKGDKGLGFGPQVNYEKKRLFIMGGYEVTEQKTLIGVGLKF